MVDQKQNTTHENAIGWLILLGVLFCLFLLFWHFFEYDMKSIFRWVRWGEMWVVSLFVGDDYTVPWNGYNVEFQPWFEAIPLLPKDDLDDPTMGVIGVLSMIPLKLPFGIIIFLMGFWALMYGPGTQFRRKLSLEGLIFTQSKIFPAISPFVKFNPSNQPPRPPGSPVPAELPSFAEALGPEEWLAYNQIPTPDGTIDEHAAYMAFARQLGARWEGPNKLPPHKQIILAACCLKAARKRTDADDMLGRAARCWSFDKGLDLGKDRKLINDARKILRSEMAKSTLAKCNRHAFHTTALLRALQTAREEGGVLAPAQFVWLRAHDRTLWYPLNNLGRQAFHMEALGAMSHFKAEKLTQRPIPKPKMDKAVSSIIDYMKSRRARPIPQLDYAGSKKRGIKKPQGGIKKPKS